MALIGQWRYSHMTEKLSAAVEIAERVYSLAQEQNDAALMIGAYRALAVPLYPSLNVEMSAGVVLVSATNNALAVANVLTKVRLFVTLASLKPLL